MYLVVRGGPTWQHEIIADLMPEPSHRKAAQRLHTYTYNLRQVFNLVGGENTYLRLRRHRYTLNRDAFDIDLWTMRDLIAEASATADPAARIEALRRAVSVYSGPFAEGADYLWLKAYRDAVRREYVAGVVRLADALIERPDDALAVLTEARRHHPDDEDLAATMLRVNGGSV